MFMHFCIILRFMFHNGATSSSEKKVEQVVFYVFPQKKCDVTVTYRFTCISYHKDLSNRPRTTLLGFYCLKLPSPNYLLSSSTLDRKKAIMLNRSSPRMSSRIVFKATLVCRSFLPNIEPLISMTKATLFSNRR